MLMATRPSISAESVLICCTNDVGPMSPERYATMYFSRVVSCPIAHATMNGSGS